MAVTISVYNHTAAKFADGSFAVGDTYKVKLLTAATFDATNTTLAATGGTEVAGANGYTTTGQALANVAVSTVTTNDAKFDADDATWTASGGNLTASYGILFNDTDANDPPLAFIDFGGSQTAGDGTDFKIVWNASGIFTFTVA
jgi:hypothetical protein